MSTPPLPTSSQQPPTPTGTRATPTPLAPQPDAGSHDAGLDPEEDVAPNLGGEDQMQDA